MVGAQLHFNNLTNKPTTVSGYGITDAMTTAHSANGITSTNISNWNSAYGWGNHALAGYAILPLQTGNSGKFLTTNGSSTSWEDAVVSVSGTSPIVSSGGTIPIISISAATSSAAGSMSAADKSKLDKFPEGTTAGQMQYWNGTAWVTVAAGTYGQVLEFRNGAPTWVDKNMNSLVIGDAYKGGIIAYILQAGDPGYDANVRHGIIAATSDQSTGVQWYNGSYTTTGATATAIGTGNANTTTIVTNQGTGSYAAKLCADLALNGYTDWYLPSKDELSKLYLNKVAVGSFASGTYWSSTEFNNLNAWYQNFGDGYQGGTGKYSTNYVRAVRAF